mmetsp:Transcript_11805/g.49471  ORF Transcript_11805/g.49471 Transcript_11805/m.49471 type:complete len:404 (+) Transcript_11805:1198-2409(+)
MHQVEDRGRHEPVVHHHVRGLHQVERLERQQPGVSGARAHQVHIARVGDGRRRPAGVGGRARRRLREVQLEQAVDVLGAGGALGVVGRGALVRSGRREASRRPAARGAIPERAPPGTPPHDDSGEETPMYFVSPSTLPEVFSRLEETNLFLMQNGQEAEAALEEMKAQQRAVRTSMERDADALHAQIDTLKTLIAAEEEEAAELRGRDVEDEKNARRRAKMERRSKGSGVSAPSSTTKAKPSSSGAQVSSSTRGEKPRVDSAAAGAGIPLELLAKKVGETYARCGFDYDPTMSTVQMLTQIESKLERCLAVADEMPAAYVRESEKAREKERRFKQRSEKAAIDLIAAEEKAKRSLERSMAPVVRKVGKPLMTRSQPPSRKKKVVKEQLTEEEAELRAFLATEF